MKKSYLVGVVGVASCLFLYSTAYIFATIQIGGIQNEKWHGPSNIPPLNEKSIPVTLSTEGNFANGWECGESIIKTSGTSGGSSSGPGSPSGTTSSPTPTTVSRSARGVAD